MAKTFGMTLDSLLAEVHEVVTSTDPSGWE
jgi:hypothetical protein